MTLFDHCGSHAERHPDATAYVWLNEEEPSERSVTFRELHESALRVATALRERQLAGRRALLMYPPGLDFIVGLLGCFAAGVVAVPMPPMPRQVAARNSVERWARIAADCSPRAVLTEQRAAAEIARGLAHHPVLAALPIFATDKCCSDTGPALIGAIDPGSSEGIAFIQYTSGSTGLPKGVLISHDNILANQEMIRRMLGHSEETVFAGWLPLYHDMGLIGNVLQPLYLGIKSVLMSPEVFIQKPVRWLQAISRFRATTSGGPNFAYELCARKVTDESLRAIDLSSWQLAFNASEPVRADTMELFSRKFKQCGFQHSAFYPSYGLAEATLIVSGGIPHEAPVILEVDAEALKANTVKCPSSESREHTRSLVGCGRGSPTEEILIVDPEARSVRSEDAIGEIWIKGPHVSRGYLDRPEVNAEIFAAKLASGAGPYLRTGDLGFIRSGELYIVGRIKDLIVVSGRNYHPQDIEQSLRGLHWAFRNGSSAAFAVEMSGTTKVGLLQEIDRKFDHVLTSGDPTVLQEMQRSVRRVVAADHGLAIHGCIFVSHGSIPKTTSGKIRRSACAHIYSSQLGSGRGSQAWSTE